VGWGAILTPLAKEILEMFCKTIKKKCIFGQNKKPPCEACYLRRVWITTGAEQVPAGMEHLLSKDKYPVIISGGIVG